MPCTLIALNPLWTGQSLSTVPDGTSSLEQLSATTEGMVCGSRAQSGGNESIGQETAFFDEEPAPIHQRIQMNRHMRLPKSIV